jgi:tRNA U34 5-carboxymethylaminomethyl modifying enzyme MnmG/GidA
MDLVTAHSIEMYRMSVIRSALKLYMKTGMKANSMYTPSNMLAAISKKSGKKYKKSKQGYEEAFNDLEQWLMMHRTVNTEEIPL